MTENITRGSEDLLKVRTADSVTPATETDHQGNVGAQQNCLRTYCDEGSITGHLKLLVFPTVMTGIMIYWLYNRR